ncbi:hypothetical protein [Novosphingobium sp.]|uniref:hypothetical protein n=1 Tax=Novosphingobium sp. TaxID=1874826 RepID=UPI00352BA5E7
MYSSDLWKNIPVASGVAPADGCQKEQVQGKDDTSAKEKGDVTAAFFRTLSKMLL